MKLYKIHTKDDFVLVEAETRDYAFAKYFKDVVENKVPLEKLGNIIVLEDGGEEYPFRTVPLLHKLGIIDDESAILSLQSIIDVSRKEARKMIAECGERDARLIPLINELMSRETKTP